MSDVGQKQPGVSTGQDLLGAQVGDLRAEVDRLNQRLGDETTRSITLPEPDTSFTILYDRTRRKDRVFATLAAFIPPETETLITRLVPFVTTANDYRDQTIGDQYDDIDDSHRAAQRVEYLFNDPLKYNTTYYFKRLIAEGQFGGSNRRKNPETEPVFAEFPANALHSFTTPERFGFPSAPGAQFVIRNERDEATGELADVVLVLRILAPLSDTGAAQTFRQVLAQNQGGVLTAECGLTRVSNGQTVPIEEKHVLSDAELDQTLASTSPPNRGYVDITFASKKIKAGVLFTWVYNRIWAGDEKKTTTGSYQFYGANENQDLNALLNVLVLITQTEPYDDGKTVRISLSFDQPSGTPVSLRNDSMWRKKASDPSYPTEPIVDRDNAISADEYHATGNHVLIIKDNLKVKPNTSYNVRVRIRTRNQAASRDVFGAFATGPSGELLNDTGVPTGLGAITRVRQKEAGLRVITPRPTDQVNTYYQNLLRIRNAAATLFLNADDLTTGTSVEANGRIETETRADTIPVFRQQLEAVFGAGATVTMDYYAVNSVGTSAISPAITYNLATGKFGPILSDTAAPNNGVAYTFTRLKYRNGKKVVGDFTVPNVQINSYDKSTVLIHDNGAIGGVRRYFDWNTKAWTTTNTEVTCGKGHFNLPIDKVDLFAGGRTIVYVVVGVYNLFNGGAVTRSSDTGNSITQAGAETDPLDQDAGVPSGLATPVLDWNSAGRVRVRGMGASTNIHTSKTRYIVLYDGTNNSSTKFFNFAARNAIVGVANEASARFDIGLAGHKNFSDIRKKFLVDVFGSGSFFAYYYEENEIGVSAKSANSNSISTNNINDYLSDTRDAARILDIQTTLIMPDQLLLNGDSDIQEIGSPNEVRYWRRWTGGTPISNGQQITTGTAGLTWQKGPHNLKWNDSTYRLIQNPGNIWKPGEYYSAAFIIQGSPVSYSPTFNITVRKDSNAFNQLEATPTILICGFSTTYAIYFATFRIATTADLSNGAGAYAPHYFVLQSQSTLDATHIAYLDRLIVVPGQNAFPFMRNAADQRGADVIPDNTFGQLVDTQFFSAGTQGGGVGPGSGGGAVAC